MAENPAESVDTTSYSDPIYDRLEGLAQRVRRAKWILIIAVIVAVVVGLLLRAHAQDRPEASSAVAFVNAGKETDPAKRRSAWEALVGRADITAFFRARAALEIVQLQLNDGAPAGAATWLDQAATHANAANDPQLELTVRLAQAAVAEDLAKPEDALAHYASTAGAAGAEFPVQHLTAQVGAARCELALGRPADVITRLEPVILRTDDASAQLVGMARVLYWQAQRSVSGTPPQVDEQGAVVTAPVAAAPVVPAVPATPAVEVVPAPAVPAAGEAVPAAPVVPATPAVAPVPPADMPAPTK